VGLVGASGTGKSSVASAAFGPLVRGVLPMTVQVHAEDSTVKTEQRSLAAHLARALGRTLTRSGDMSARRRSDLRSQTSPDENVGRSQRSSSAELGVFVGPVLAKLGTTVSPLVQVAIPMVSSLGRRPTCRCRLTRR
jgi:hypothetical protein